MIRLGNEILPEKEKSILGCECCTPRPPFGHLALTQTHTFIHTHTNAHTQTLSQWLAPPISVAYGVYSACSRRRSNSQALHKLPVLVLARKHLLVADNVHVVWQSNLHKTRLMTCDSIKHVWFYSNAKTRNPLPQIHSDWVLWPP